MNPRIEKQKMAFQQQQDNSILLKLKENFNQNIFYIEPNRYSIEMKQFNFRNPTYGVTVEYNFLKKIQECEYLESSQLQFYMNLFRLAYSNVKSAAATCYFFNDLIVTPQKTIQPQQQSQIIKLDQKRPNVQQDSQEQNKIVDPPKPTIQKELPFNQLNQFEPKKDSLPITNNDETEGKQIKQQEKPKTAKKFDYQQPNSQVISSNLKTQEKKSFTQQTQQNQQQKKNKQEDNKIDNIQQANQQSQQQQQQVIIQGKGKQQAEQNNKQQNQKQSQTNPNASKIQSVQDSTEQESETNQIPQNQDQNQQIKNEDKKATFDQQKINQILVPQKNVQGQIDQKQIYPTVQQDGLLLQDSVKQVQKETEQQLQIQPTIEKKFHFQIINMTVEQPAPQEIIQKQQLASLMKQFAESNNLTEDQLKNQDYWFFPINQLQAHWISVVVQFNPKIIYYFDSYYNKITPLIMQGIYSILEYQNFNPKDFRVEPIYNKQINGYDCGIFLLLSLLYTLKNQKYDYNQRKVDMFRKKILYNLAVIGAQTDIKKEFLEYLIGL